MIIRTLILPALIFTSIGHSKDASNFVIFSSSKTIQEAIQMGFVHKECVYSIDSEMLNTVDIWKVNKKIDGYLDSLAQLKKTHKSDEYRKQYIYFSCNRKKYLVANIFPKRNEFPNWRKSIVFVYDGGISFCRVRFNIEKEKVESYDCNGNA